MPGPLLGGSPDRYDRLDEREIAADLVPWLIMERAKLSREQAELTVSLRRRWREGDLGEDVGSPR